MQVIKRDGRKVDFAREKIVQAISKAFIEVDGELSDSAIEKANAIADYVEKQNKDFTVEEIQDIVERKLMTGNRKDVAKAYIIYRNERTKIREGNSKLIQKVFERINATNIENANANVDEKSFNGREKEASADVQKFIALELGGLSEPVANAHKEMLIYQHDLEKAVLGEHNCLFLNFNEVFKYGFTTRNGDVRPPASFSTACQLVAVAFQCQSQVQFGGVGSLHIDYDLAPFVKMSFAKHFKDGLQYVERADSKYIASVPKLLEIESEEAKQWKNAYEYAMDMLEKEGREATQALYHNLNTLESRPGSQVPFTSINFGRNTTPEGRLAIKWLLEAGIDGIGKHH